MSYIAEERETICTTSDLDKIWNVYTRQRKIINKLIKNGYEPFNVEMEGDIIIGAEFNLDFNKITFKKAITSKKEYSDCEKEVLRERLMKARGL